MNSKISWTPAGTIKVASCGQLLKARFSMLVTPAGNAMEDSCVQPKKHEYPTVLRRLLSANVTVANASQPAKAWGSRFSTPAGTVKVGNLLQFLKLSEPILETLDGNVMEVRCVQS